MDTDGIHVQRHMALLSADSISMSACETEGFLGTWYSHITPSNVLFTSVTFCALIQRHSLKL